MGALADSEIRERTAGVDSVDPRGLIGARRIDSVAPRESTAARRIDREARDLGDRLDRAQKRELFEDGKDKIIGKF